MNRRSTDRVQSRRRRVRVLAIGLCLSLGGGLVGLVASVPTRWIYGRLFPPEAVFGQFLLSYVVQPGMGALAVGYVWWRWRDDLAAVVRIRRPTLEGVAWMALGPVAYEVLTRVTRRVITALGVEAGVHTGPPTWRLLLESPALVLPGVLALVVALAPMEELLYRGVIHAELARGFGVAARVVVGAVLFGSMHLLFGGPSSLLLVSAGGLVFGAAYERTDNLAVPVVIHAAYWLAT